MSLGSEPLISIIVAVYNGAKTLQQCIDSVARQTYPNKELILIDGGSKDGTVELLRKNHEKIAFWVSEPDRGIYHAFNKGLEKSKGAWVCFLGADDIFWDSQVLERMSKQLQKLPLGIRVAYGKIMLVTESGKDLFTLGQPWQKIKSRFGQIMCVPHTGVMHSVSLFKQYGRFDESFRIAGDYEFLLRELKTGDAVFASDVIITRMCLGGISSDPRNTLLAMREMRRAQRIHGQRFPGWIWFSAMVRVYLRLLLWRMLGENSARKVLDVQRRILGLPPLWTRG